MISEIFLSWLISLSTVVLRLSMACSISLFARPLTDANILGHCFVHINGIKPGLTTNSFFSVSFFCYYKILFKKCTIQFLGTVAFQVEGALRCAPILLIPNHGKSLQNVENSVSDQKQSIAKKQSTFLSNM